MAIDTKRLLYLSSLGLNIIPVEEGTKKSKVKWKPYQTNTVTPKQIEKWQGNTLTQFDGVAFVCGTVSGVVVMDCDSLETVKWLENHELFVPTPAIIKTRRGKHYWYRLSPDQLVATKKLNSKDVKLDLKGERGIALCPPTKNYSFESFPENFEDIPYFPEEYNSMFKTSDSSNGVMVLESSLSGSDEFSKLMSLFDKPLKLGEKRNIYVKDTYNVLKSNGFEVIKENAGPMKSDTFHVNGYVVFSGCSIIFFSGATRRPFAIYSVPVEVQLELAKEVLSKPCRHHHPQ